MSGATLSMSSTYLKLYSSEESNMTAQITSCFKINETEWQGSQIDMLAYQRNLHMLHSFLRHGVIVEKDGQALTANQIDYLTAEEAWQVSINTRDRYSNEDMLAHYQSDFELSDAMWRDLAFSPDKPMKVSHCEMAVEGLSINEFMTIMRDMQTDERILLAVHPEHFKGIVTDDKILSVEPFGMYGTPTLVTVNVLKDSELSPQILTDKDNTYPLAMAGEAYLTDGTAVNVPYHQFKPTENGFVAKLAVYWPENAPEEIVEGHSLHLATEFYYGLQRFTQE